MEKKQITLEYKDIITYMTDVLAFEFPSKELTADHLVLSILDGQKCHAYIILDNILMDNTIEYLRDYYADRVKRVTEDVAYKKKKVTKFNKELTDIIDLAVDKSETNIIGTEHILLAILDSEKNFPCASKLHEFGISYNYIAKKCDGFENTVADVAQAEPRKKAKGSEKVKEDKPILKSQVNSFAIANNGSTETIDKYTINLHDEINNGHYDKLVGRENILNNIIKVLSRRKKNNVVLVGKPGTGKTSLGYRLAEMIDNGNVPQILEGKKVIMLNTIALVSGTHLRGMFEERVNNLFNELKANPNYILFIDDMQNVVRNNGKDKDGDLTDIIGKILSEGDVRVIGTISFKDYRNGIEGNSVLSTKLQKIVVEPSSQEETFEILKVNKHYYEKFHHVQFNEDCLWKAIKLADRYITNNSLPDSAIDIIDLTGAAISLTNKQGSSIKDIKTKLEELNKKKLDAMNHGDFEKVNDIALEESELNADISNKKKAFDNDKSTWLNATENDIAETVSEITSIPVAKMKSTEKETILHIDDILKKDVIGQDEAIDEVAKVIKRNRAGFGDKSKTIATLLCVGKTGVGKTVLAKKLAENIFGDEKALIRFDMSEYQDKTSVNKLIGASAGYVGYENGGLLTEAVKNKPYCVLLFDEIEKADESIYNLFLQLFDEGRLTDNNGTSVNFKNVIIMMTSNVGARQASELGNGIGFSTNIEENKKSIIDKAIRKKFNPEFINRIDKIIHFNSLTDDNLKAITKIELNKLSKRVMENGITLNYDDKVVDFVYKQAIKEKEYGARPIMRIIQDNVSDSVVDYVLSSNMKNKSYNITIDGKEKVVVSESK